MLERILERMKEKNINKSQLSKLCNLPKTTIYSALATDKSLENANLETIRPIAEVLELSLDYIINGKVESETANINNFYFDIIDRYSKLTANEKNRVKGYIDAILAARGDDAYLLKDINN